MSLTHKSVGDAHLMCLSGRLDNSNARSIGNDILAFVDQPHPRIALDFETVDYISSAGLRTILDLAEHVRRKQGRIVLCGLLPHLCEVFELCGLLPLLEVDATRDAALARLAEWAPPYPPT